MVARHGTLPLVLVLGHRVLPAPSRAVCYPLRKTTPRLQAAGPQQPLPSHQSGAPLPPASRPSEAAQSARQAHSSRPPPLSTRQGKLQFGGLLLLWAAYCWWAGVPDIAVTVLILFIFVLLIP